MLLTWEDDPITAAWAQKCPLPVSSVIQPQYDGQKYIHEATWLKHIECSSFPEYCIETYDHNIRKIRPSPAHILQCFRDQAYLEALVLIVAWGGMTRTKRRIYTEPTSSIATTLKECVHLTQQHASIACAWKLLVCKLRWGMVITSKVLHFLARSLGYEQNPPVAIDNKVILEQVWPKFISAVRTHHPTSDIALSSPWFDDHTSWEAYNRYMTAIRYWAQAKTWSTTQLETTIFAEYYPVPKLITPK